MHCDRMQRDKGEETVILDRCRIKWGVLKYGSHSVSCVGII